MGKAKRKNCISSPIWRDTCDGCKSNGTKCPSRDKFRMLRNTKDGEKKYPIGGRFDGQNTD